MGETPEKKQTTSSFVPETQIIPETQLVSTQNTPQNISQKSKKSSKKNAKECIVISSESESEENYPTSPVFSTEVNTPGKWTLENLIRMK